MSKINKIIILLFAIFFLTSCEKDIGDTNLTNLGPVTKELQQKIIDLYNNNSEYENIVIYSHLESTIHTKNLLYTYYTYEMTETFGLAESYYYGIYADSSSNTRWLYLEDDDISLIKREAIDSVVTIEYLENNEDTFFDITSDPRTFFNLFFITQDYTTNANGDYLLSIPYSVLVDDPLTSEYFLDLDIEFINLEDIDVDIVFHFEMDSLLFNMTITGDVDKFTDNFIVIDFEAFLSFPETIPHFLYNEENYYIEAAHSIEKSTKIYEVDDTPKLYFKPGYNVIQYFFEPGYYNFSFTDSQSSVSHIIDESGNRIEATPFFRIPESGCYYLFIQAGQEGKSAIDITKLLESKIGTIENPTIADSTFTGEYDARGEMNYHLLNIPQEGAIIKITADFLTRGNIYVSYNGHGTTLTESSCGYYVIPVGYQAIISIYSTYTTDYELSYEILPYTDVRTNIEEMPEIEVCVLSNCRLDAGKHPNIFLGADITKVYFKFVIVRGGQYNPRLYSISNSGFVECAPFIKVYKENGELIDNNFDGTFVPGNYYIEFCLFETDYGIFELFLERII